MRSDEIRETGICGYATQDNRAVVEVLTEIAAQLAEANEIQRALHPELTMPAPCQQRKCDYFTDYLAHGPADLTHEGFHEASTQAAAHMKACSRIERTGTCTTCSNWERTLRA